MPNYAFTTGKDMPDIENGHTFTEYNFYQKYPHTDIFVGKTGLTFVGCNLLNCDVPGDATIEDSLHIHKSLCSHLHPEYNIQPVCVDDCEHVVDTDEVWIDSVLVDTTYHRKDLVVS